MGYKIGVIIIIAIQGLNHFDFHYGRREMVWYNTVKEAIVKGNSTRNQIIHKGQVNSPLY